MRGVQDDERYGDSNEEDIKQRKREVGVRSFDEGSGGGGVGVDGAAKPPIG